jgi:hypothetical protein
MMLQLSPSPDAARARRSRARLKAGVRTFRVRAHGRRLVAAMHKANPNLGDDDLDQKAIELELDDCRRLLRSLGWACKETASRSVPTHALRAAALNAMLHAQCAGVERIR